MTRTALSKWGGFPLAAAISIDERIASGLNIARVPL
jgi:hypothetical protein